MGGARSSAAGRNFQQEMSRRMNKRGLKAFSHPAVEKVGDMDYYGGNSFLVAKYVFPMDVGGEDPIAHLARWNVRRSPLAPCYIPQPP